MLLEEHLIALGQQLAMHRSALREIREKQASHEQAIAAIQATLQTSGVGYDSRQHGQDSMSGAAALLDDEAQRCLKHALGGPGSMGARTARK